MNTRAFNEFLSTERFMMKVYNQYEEKFITSLYKNKFGKEDIKYRKSAVRYFFDQTLIKAVSNEKTFSSKLVLGDVLEYDLNKMNGYTSKYLNKWILDILKTLYSDKLVFEDTYFISNLISSLGNTMNMKYLPETVNEIIRQGKVDLARSTNTLEANCGSYNMMILLS